MPDTTLQLGDLEFASFEIPEQIGFGGEQKLIVHELVGGIRVVDAMGEQPTALEWSGIFVGQSALDRALYLDGLRKAGKPLYLTWSEFAYTVVIRSFRCSFVRFYRLPYSLTCEVVEDLTTPITQLVDPDTEQLVSDDLDDANGLAAGIGDPTLSSLMGTLTTAISTVGNLSAAAQSALGAILLPLGAARTQVSSLIAAADTVIDGASSFGGVVPGGFIAQQVLGLAAQTNATSTLPSLIGLDRTLGRMATNIGLLNAGTKSITLAGGNLFSVAADQYGDAMGWTALAAANGLSDPQLSGIETLTIPQFLANTGGILGG